MEELDRMIYEADINCEKVKQHATRLLAEILVRLEMACEILLYGGPRV